MARATPDQFCVQAISVAPAFAPSTILTHCDTALPLVIFLQAGRYGAPRLPIQTFAPAALVYIWIAAHANGRKLIRLPAQTVEVCSFKHPNQIAFDASRSCRLSRRTDLERRL